MTDRFNVLAEQLFQKNLDDCSVEELENLAREYPYFAPAQYILLSRLKNADYNAYQAQLQKAILYYHDPLAFDHFLNAEAYSVDFTAFPVEEVVLPMQNDEADTTQHQLEKFNTTDQPEVTDIENAEETSIEEQPIAEKTIEDDVVNERIVNDGPEEEISLIHEQPVIEKKFEGDVAEQTIVNDTPKQEISPLEIGHEEIQPKPVLPAEASQPETVLAFEPYHTVDYFASQGIKLSQEEASRDKFGKQLKSFTEWLKTMKKLPVAEQVRSLDSRSEEKVENLAAHSVEGQEVYTETMAEVWAQQGNKEKAVEVYNKLSLINPSKRAYFAAKIDSLK